MPEAANTSSDFLAQSLQYVRTPDLPDMTIRQLAILGAICDDAGPRKVKDIADHLGVSKPVVTRATQVLIDFGFAMRERCETDKRNVRIFATAGGRKTRNQINALSAALSAALPFAGAAS